MADIRDQMIAARNASALGSSTCASSAHCRRRTRKRCPPMQTERQQRAASYRAQVSEQSQQIKAEADRKVTVITAQAQQQSEQIPRRRRPASATAFSPRPTAPIRNSSPSTDRWKPTRTASTTARPGR